MNFSSEFFLTNNEKKLLLDTARKTIQANLTKSNPPKVKAAGLLKQHCGVFVSLHKHSKLRGCIGYIRSEKAVPETVIDAAGSAAFNDYRFTPVTKEEYKDLEIEISVLSPFKKINSIKDIQVGIHGLYISDIQHSGLLLPQVAIENNWDRDQFLTQCCKKAGIPSNSWKNNKCKIEIFSALVFS